MCGGANEKDRLAEGETFNPTSLDAMYKQFRETGQVPYSYYGGGAPSRDGEIEALRRSYPSAFVRSQTPQQPQGPFAALLSAMRSRFPGVIR